jgi:hypothetical protein
VAGDATHLPSGSWRENVTRRPGRAGVKLATTELLALLDAAGEVPRPATWGSTSTTPLCPTGRTRLARVTTFV